MRLPQAQYKQVSQCTTTHDIWSRLKRVYDETAESKSSNLFLQFIHLKKKTTESMKTYLDKLVGLYHDLNSYDISIGELALCTKALDGLPENYQQVKAAARASQVNTIPRLTNLLLSAERDGHTELPHFQKPDIHNLNSELRSLKSQLRNFRNSNSKPTKYCHHCKMNNHSSRECGLLHPELRQKAKQNRNAKETTRQSPETTNKPNSAAFIHQPPE